MTETILVIAAHHDDAVIGAGGTMAKYAKEGNKVHAIIFAHDVMPHLRKDVVQKKTERESKKAKQILGATHITFLGNKPLMEISKIIKEEKPVKIFTHDKDDADPLHRKVHETVMQLVNDRTIKLPVYSFTIWSFGKLRKRQIPKLVVDITSTFKEKINATLAHESKWWTLNLLLWKLILQAKISGITYRVRYAEVFYKLN